GRAPLARAYGDQEYALAGHLGHGNDIGRGLPGAASVRPQAGGWLLAANGAGACSDRDAPGGDPRGTGGTTLHRPGSRRPRSCRLRHPGGAAADMALRAAAGCRSRTARGYTRHPDGRRRRIQNGSSAGVLEPLGQHMATNNRSSGPGGQRQTKVRLKTAKQRSASSQRWLERQLNDPYVAAAKRQGYRSRAAFKLAEIDAKHRLLKPGKRVVDLGAAPGGWAQVAADRVKSVEGRG